MKATDPQGAQAMQTFSLTVNNVNDAPLAAASAVSAQATEDAPFSFSLPSGFFSDADAGDALTVTASNLDGSALPSWLSFDRSTRTLHGTPENDDVGSVAVKLTATDMSGARVSTTVTIGVANTNDAPIVAHAIADQGATEDTGFHFTVPADAFADVDGDALTLSATLADGSALPGWLSFDAATRTFSGTPGNANVGAINVRVAASDGSVGVAAARRQPAHRRPMCSPSRWPTATTRRNWLRRSPIRRRCRASPSA